MGLTGQAINAAVPSIALDTWTPSFGETRDSCTRVQPGVLLSEPSDAVAIYGLTFTLDPAAGEPKRDRWRDR